MCRYITGKEKVMERKADSSKDKVTEVFYEVEKGEYIKFDMTLQMQILFDDPISLISVTD